MSKSKKGRKAEKLARLLGMHQDSYRKPKFQPNRRARPEEIQQLFEEVMGTDPGFQVQFIKDGSE